MTDERSRSERDCRQIDVGIERDAGVEAEHQTVDAAQAEGRGERDVEPTSAEELLETGREDQRRNHPDRARAGGVAADLAAVAELAAHAAVGLVGREIGVADRSIGNHRSVGCSRVEQLRAMEVIATGGEHEKQREPAHHAGL